MINFEHLPSLLNTVISKETANKKLNASTLSAPDSLLLANQASSAASSSSAALTPTSDSPYCSSPLTTSSLSSLNSQELLLKTNSVCRLAHETSIIGGIKNFVWNKFLIEHDSDDCERKLGDYQHLGSARSSSGSQISKLKSSSTFHYRGNKVMKIKRAQTANPVQMCHSNKFKSLMQHEKQPVCMRKKVQLEDVKLFEESLLSWCESRKLKRLASKGLGLAEEQSLEVNGTA